jgi:hypothetical protein
MAEPREDGPESEDDLPADDPETGLGRDGAGTADDPPSSSEGAGGGVEAPTNESADPPLEENDLEETLAGDAADATEAGTVPDQGEPAGIGEETGDTDGVAAGGNGNLDAESVSTVASETLGETEDTADTQMPKDAHEGGNTVSQDNGEYVDPTADPESEGSVPPYEERFPAGEDGGPSEMDDSVSSIAGRAKPALAERQALIAVAGAMGLGVFGAVVGVLLDMTVRDVKFVLSLGGLLIFTMAVFVLFRAMLSAAERNDEPVKTALTHPLFMFLFVVLATATALFIGLLRRAY